MKAFLTSSLFLLLALASSSPGLAAANSKSHRTIDLDDAYKNNCMRCHTALPQYSPRMSKTTVMHMRVAANIPADEAAAILAYLNDSPQASTKAAPNHSPVTVSNPQKEEFYAQSLDSNDNRNCPVHIAEHLFLRRVRRCHARSSPNH